MGKAQFLAGAQMLRELKAFRKRDVSHCIPIGILELSLRGNLFCRHLAHSVEVGLGKAQFLAGA